MSSKREKYEQNPWNCIYCDKEIPYQRYKEKRKYKKHNPNFVFCDRQCCASHRSENKASNVSKYCKGCDQERNADQFYFSNKEKTRLTVLCKVCQGNYVQERCTLTREYTTLRQRAWKYGIKPEQIKAMFDKQKGICLVCKVQKARDIDHCHKTGKVRGMLCGRCNTGLGMLGDDINNLKNAILYLERNSDD